MADMQSIWDKLKLMEGKVPLGPCPKGWCFDQLLGAAFALTKAEEVGAPDPNAQALYRQEVLSVRDEQPPAFPAFAWGFYLNSAIHRVVWGCERVLRAITNRDDRDDTFGKVVKNAWDACKKMEEPPSLTKVLMHFPTTNGRYLGDGDYEKCTNVDENNVLRILRGRVDRQKHLVKRAARATSGSDTEGPWDDLSPERQRDLVMHALKLIINLYWEEEKARQA